MDWGFGRKSGRNEILLIGKVVLYIGDCRRVSFWKDK